MITSAADQAYMAAALALAQRGLGDTWPNPAVGCVLVKDGVVVGRGWTQSGGRPHAEQVALSHAGVHAKGATAYVSLEPCSHQGKTPPCADALQQAGVTRVVIGISDPDPRVAGGGIARLRASGIIVDVGIGEPEAEHANRGFFLRITKKRPLFALKTATGLDGRIAMASGESKWITGAAARGVAQSLRARYDAILAGSETVLADDPALTCRLDGYTGRPKVRVILDRRLRLPLTAQVVRTAREVPTWVVTSTAAAEDHRQALIDAGVSLISLPETPDAVAFARATAAALAERGLTRVLIEGGGTVAASYFAAGLIDEMAWFRAASVMGGDSRAAVAALGINRLSDIPSFKRISTLALGDDVLDMFEPEGRA